MPSTSPITIVPVETPRHREEFIRFPWHIYRSDPLWVPPLIGPQRTFLDPQRGPFFTNGEARLFLAQRQGRTVGRLAAHRNYLYEKYHDQESGFFGFFESEPDQEIAAALFNTATEYLAAQGKTRLLGPMNFTVYDEIGLLVKGFDTMPALFQTHNPPYYLDLLEGLGFVKAFDFLGFQIDERHIDAAAMAKQVQRIEAKNPTLRFVPFRWRDFSKWAEAVYDLFNEAWEGNWGHVPLDRAMFKKFFDQLKPLIRPELVHLVVEGERLIAFGIAAADINPLVQRLNGRFTLWDKLRLFYAARYQTIHKARALVVGVRKHYRHLKLHHAMILKGYLHLARHTPCQVCDLSLVPENLRPWVKTLEMFGARRYKTFRILEKAI